KLSRIVETGQVELVAGSTLQYAITSHAFDASNHIKVVVQGVPRKYVTSTIYDYNLLELETVDNGLSPQENLRNRVSSILYTASISNNQDPYAYYSHASPFSYDAMGNVKTLVQD